PCIALTASGAMQFGVLPRVVEPGLSASMALLLPRLAVELAVSHWVERSLPQDGFGRSGGLRLTSAQLATCIRWGRSAFELPACGALELGSLWSQGSGTIEPNTSRLLWVAIVLGVRPTWVVNR